MTKKEIQRLRTMKYFIDAANSIIEEEGIEKVTIRKVADIAGYNSATIYNYFENLDHLMFYCSMKYLKNYAFRLPKELVTDKGGVEKFLSTWFVFSGESFKNPAIFYSLFFSKFSSNFNGAVKDYYGMFPENLSSMPEEFMPMMLERNIYQRDYRALELCAKEGYLRDEDLKEINEMIMLMYQSMLLRLNNEEIDCTSEEAVEKIIKYIRVILANYLLK